MTVELIRELWEYHHWANRRLFEVTAALGEEAAGRDLGGQFSLPTLRGMFTHVYGADRWWLDRFTGRPQHGPPDMLYGDAPKTLGELRGRWDELEVEQRRFLAVLSDADLGRTVEGRTRDGKPFSRPFGMLLLHVPNHATHHRSEIATMLTIVAGSPPDTGINSYYTQQSG
ncbi:MAG TPA: DinB family protein [Methylomirabilota bacterium]|nr:DinB family protein [Methylomirabilota bacterium]